MTDEAHPAVSLPETLWPTTRAAVDAIDGLHRLTGLPWWATLTLTAVGEPPHQLSCACKLLLHAPAHLQHLFYPHRCQGGAPAGVHQADAGVGRLLGAVEAGAAERAGAALGRCRQQPRSHAPRRRTEHAGEHPAPGGRCKHAGACFSDSTHAYPAPAGCIRPAHRACNSTCWADRIR